MAMKVTIKQNDPEFDTLSIIDPGSESFLNLILDAEKKSGNATSAVLKLTDGDFKDYTVTLTGTDLTFDGGGLLDSGVIDAITFKNGKGKVVASIATKEAGGLNIDVDDAQAASNSAGSIAALLAEWDVTFDAKAMPKSKVIWDPFGATFEGGDGGDKITGSKRIDFLSGGNGDDVIDGGAGNDEIKGDNTGHLMLDEPTGNDILKGGDGDDAVHGEGGNDTVYGGKGNDNLTGDSLDSAGDDKLFGDAGNDWLSGGEGNDVLNGGKGQDRVLIHNDLGDFTFTINLAEQTVTGQGNDELISIEHASGSRWHDNIIIGSKAVNSLIGGEHNDTIDGAAGNDKLHGASDADTVIGGAGNDLIAGGEGNDMLTGNAGKDMFYFAETGAAHSDQITDFTSKDDQIYLSVYAAAGLLTGKVKSQMFKVLENGATVDNDDRYIYDKAEGILYFDRDGSGGSAREEVASFEIGTTLAAKDLEVRQDIGTSSFL
jgi:Ca2+-binding RTX toxin-like protein